ncbi:MAG: HIT family protein [Patescibacteria group bacterium]|jgi:diadenosine tetraphosphate (Ap4A) HIT family hydrolase
MDACRSCKSISGEDRISPGPPIYTGKHWALEHAYPVALVGWVVLVLKEHKETIAELTPPEWAEFGVLLPAAVRLVKEYVFSCESQYVLSLNAAKGFHHVHWHVIPVTPDVPKELRGSRIFALAGGKDQYPAADASLVTRWCAEARSAFPGLL